jgi:hypothetical protein
MQLVLNRHETPSRRDKARFIEFDKFNPFYWTANAMSIFSRVMIDVRMLQCRGGFNYVDVSFLNIHKKNEKRWNMIHGQARRWSLAWCVCCRVPGRVSRVPDTR